MHIFLLIISSTCLFTSLVMIIWFKTNRILNFYLIFTFCFASLYLLLYSLNHLILFQKIDFPKLNYYQVILILMPTLYLYYTKLIKNIKFIEKEDLQHFIFPLIIILLINYFSFLNYTFLPLAVFLFSMFYLYKTFLILKFNYWSVKTNQPFTYDFSIIRSWTKFLFIIQVLYLFIINLSNIFIIVNNNTRCNFYFEFSLLTLYSIVYLKIVFSPSIFYGNSSLFKRIESASVSKICISSVWHNQITVSKMSNKEQLLLDRIENNIIVYVEQIEEIALSKFSFRNPEYSLYKLSVDLGIPKYYLDFIFKYHCKVSFVEYKKMVRIYDSIQLISSGYLKSNKLDTLSKYVGFSSYNPFLVSFKELTGVSPFEFYRNRKITKHY